MERRIRPRAPQMAPRMERLLRSFWVREVLGWRWPVWRSQLFRYVRMLEVGVKRVNLWRVVCRAERRW